MELVNAQYVVKSQRRSTDISSILNGLTELDACGSMFQAILERSFLVIIEIIKLPFLLLT
jgi:hypothetical protein